MTRLLKNTWLNQLVKILGTVAVATTVLLLLSSCGPPTGAQSEAPLSVQAGPDVNLEPTTDESVYITLGDIDPNEPAKKIKRLLPLADYLAENLASEGITAGRVVIARC